MTNKEEMAKTEKGEQDGEGKASKPREQEFLQHTGCAPGTHPPAAPTLPPESSMGAHSLLQSYWGDEPSALRQHSACLPGCWAVSVRAERRMHTHTQIHKHTA